MTTDHPSKLLPPLSGTYLARLTAADHQPFARSEFERHLLRTTRRLTDEGKTALLRGLRALTAEERHHA